jgi:hypothetical protein
MPQEVSAALYCSGITDIRNIVPANTIAGVLLVYAESLNRIWYFCIGIAIPSFVFDWFMGWQDIRKKLNETAESGGSPTDQRPPAASSLC